MSIPESAPVGSVVGRIWAKDKDVGLNAEMKYSIIDGDGRDTFDISTDPTNVFGLILVKKVEYIYIWIRVKNHPSLENTEAAYMYSYWLIY